MNGTEALAALRSKGYRIEGEVDQAAVARWTSDAAQASRQERYEMGRRLANDLALGKNPFGNSQANLVTVAAIADALLS